jgi:deoxyribodipyrimidine photo-lyase
MPEQDSYVISKTSSIHFPADYDSILQRMHSVDPVLYGKSRNYINGAVTYLSPYISRGVITVKEVMDTVLQKGYHPAEIEVFLKELAWREYFQRVWQYAGSNINKDIKQPQQAVMHHHMIDAVNNARTGVQGLDTAIKQLYNSGYIHNHVRMYLASVICNVGKAYWLHPSAWLYYHLLDGDIASNICSWQWVCGTFASKKYYFNQDNLNKYSNTNQQNTFLDKSYEEIFTMPVPAVLQSNSMVNLQTQLPHTPVPSISLNKPTLIYNTYNLDAKWRITEDVNRVLLLEPSHFNQHPVSQHVIEFVMALAKNINNLFVYTGEIAEVASWYTNAGMAVEANIISKEHPAFAHYPGIKDDRHWMYPSVTGYYPSFFSYWKACKKFLM